MAFIAEREALLAACDPEEIERMSEAALATVDEEEFHRSERELLERLNIRLK